jgi:Fe2+ or Zn2+ uptake regulation protein
MPPQRQTRQHQLILEAVKASKLHPTADMVFDEVRVELPKISLGTVYRNLDALVLEGLIRRIDGPGPHRRYDGNTRPHHHARCTVCDKITDLFEIPDRGLDQIAESECGFAIDQTNIEFTGVCNSCRQEQTQAKAPN